MAALKVARRRRRSYIPWEAIGHVYLLHFDRPISRRHTCQHYMGWCTDLTARIWQHWLGRGSRLTRVARRRGIGFTVARVWRGSRELELKLKARHESPRLCPICREHVPAQGFDELTPAQIEAKVRMFLR